MRMILRTWILWFLAVGTSIAQDTPSSLFQALNAVHVDSSRVHYVRDLVLRRDVVRLAFIEGKIAFLTPVNGHITGLVFTGTGRVLAVPRDLVEKRSLARFLGAPLLDQAFSRAYIRFTDQTSEEVVQLLQEAGSQPTIEPGFEQDWNILVSNLNPGHSLRVLEDWLAANPLPYFYAGLIGDSSGPFDVLVDDRRDEQVLLGQPRWVEGIRFYDVWASFPRVNSPGPVGSGFFPNFFRVDTSIQADRSLQGRTEMVLKAMRAGERLVPLELSRHLKVEAVSDAAGHTLTFFQNEETGHKGTRSLGNDSLYVVLPEPVRMGQELHLNFTYRGSVISDAGNGVYFVGDRGSWYPNIGTDHFAQFELTFRWPRRLQLVATGKKLEEREDGDWRVGIWKSEIPIPVAGFNLGEYVAESVPGGAWHVDLYANRQFEDAILRRFSRGLIVLNPPRVPTPGRPSVSTQRVVIAEPPPPSPAVLLKQLGNDIAEAVRFNESISGPFPFDHLSVAQIPGSFGQGWPGLLYLSTYSFMTPEAQERAGIVRRVQEQFTELMPFHEVGHQWWGNLVSTSGYRDVWIQEGLSNYVALLFVESKHPGGHELAHWLEMFRSELLAKEAGQDQTKESGGPLSLGYRLLSSRSPTSYVSVIYSKGAWVFHMLRCMLRQDGARDPDARFVQFLRILLERHRHSLFTTEDFQRSLEKIMTPAMDLEGTHSMDWFFDQWVRGTGIPRFSVIFEVRPLSPVPPARSPHASSSKEPKAGSLSAGPEKSTQQAGSFVIRGKLRQSEVPGEFLAAVPLYAVRPSGKPLFLGNVITSGEETPFKFVAPFQPRRLLIDPNMTLLARTN